MNGARVGITAARRAQEQATLVGALGGVPVIGPTIDIDRPAPDKDVAGQLRAALATPVDTVVVMTGIGARHVMAVAERTGLTEQLRALCASAFVIARGQKARAALRRLDLHSDVVADPPESRGVLHQLTTRGLAGHRLMVICGGPTPDPFVAPVRSAGAQVCTVHPYSIEAPRDEMAALALVRAAIANEIAAITFTSANAVNGFVALAERAGLDTDAIADQLLMVAVGPVTREAMNAHGLRVDVEPQTPRMGAMYHALAAALRAQSRSVTSGHSSTD